MSEPAPLADLLDRARLIFSLAGDFGRSFEEEHSERLPQIGRSGWDRYAGKFEEFCNELLEIKSNIQNPPKGFEAVAEVLFKAARIAKKIRDVVQRSDGREWAVCQEFFPDLNTIAEKGTFEIQLVNSTHLSKDPFDFLEKDPSDDLKCQNSQIEQDTHEPYESGWSQNLPPELENCRLVSLHLTTPPPVTTHIAKSIDGRWFEVLWDVFSLKYKWHQVTEKYAKAEVKYVLDAYGIQDWRQLFVTPRSVPSDSNERSENGKNLDTSRDEIGLDQIQTNTRKRKRSTERGEGRAKLIAALSKHHKYSDKGALNFEPIGNNELARLAGVSESTASAFFEKEFKGHAKYRAMCANKDSLLASLKLLNQEFSPHILFGALPPNESDEED